MREAGPSGTAEGAFVAVVGASGVGKDTLIASARERLGEDARFAFPHRWITRPPDATEQSEELTREEWERRRAAGLCALAWEAHGIAYGIPAGVDGELAAGRIVVANVSRAVLDEARRRFGRCEAIMIEAKAETLALRLTARGREGAAARARRLARPTRALPPGLPVHRIVNDGTLATAARLFHDTLLRIAGDRPAESVASR